MTDLNELWNSPEQENWDNALGRYWGFVKPENFALEQKLSQLDLEEIRLLNAPGWFDFLQNEYFRWKYTAANRYATTIKRLRWYADHDALDELHAIKLQLLEIDPANIFRGLELAQRIRGLGTAGASGLLSLMYPALYATVDQFVVKALRSIKGLLEAEALVPMNENSLTTADGVRLIAVLKRKANELNACFGNKEWTPRKLDMILWTYGRGEESAAAMRPRIRRNPPGSRRSQSNDPSGVWMNNHDMIASAVKSYSGTILQTNQIKEIVGTAFPSFADGSLLPNDHATGNKSSCSCANTARRIFEKIGPGKYRVR